MFVDIHIDILSNNLTNLSNFIVTDVYQLETIWPEARFIHSGAFSSFLERLFI